METKSQGYSGAGKGQQERIASLEESIRRLNVLLDKSGTYTAALEARLRDAEAALRWIASHSNTSFLSDHAAAYFTAHPEAQP